MEIFPPEYQRMTLSQNEKRFVEDMAANDTYGYLLLGANPAMHENNDSIHIFICPGGVLLFKFFEGLEDAAQFGAVMPALIRGLYRRTAGAIASKMLAGKAHVDRAGRLGFAVNLLYVFPALRREGVREAGDEELKAFIRDHCLFQEELQSVGTGLSALAAAFLARPITELSAAAFEINDEKALSILQRLAPEYAASWRPRSAGDGAAAGADGELLTLTEDDAVAKALRLDAWQLGIVNGIGKGERLLLAREGSEKCALVLAKCFKAAAVNRDRQFLILCRSGDLRALYDWLIDRAGLRATNVSCLTFHALCRTLLRQNGRSAEPEDFDGWISDARRCFRAGQIPDRYYGIFIDEAQKFEPEWYQFCFDLLENKATGDHLFVICADKTQRLAGLRRQGREPWNAGEGYPEYSGENAVEIERNYCNCIEISEYIRRYIGGARRYLSELAPDAKLTPDEFLRGTGVFRGKGVTVRRLVTPFERSNGGEAEAIVDSIRTLHDRDGIPYDEIAVLMYNRKYKKSFAGWNSRMEKKEYYLEPQLKRKLAQEGIRFCRMYGDSDELWGARYGDDGVRLLGFRSAPGLDFRAVIVCGLLPLGEYNGTKTPDWARIKTDGKTFREMLKHTKDDIRLLYSACARAREALHLILPETGRTSVYMKLLEEAEA